ncbi:MAG: GGDEF domain-containing protein [Holophaga sp.]|nr:GGDEF domain-containing protein [Holophaga sp.]
MQLPPRPWPEDTDAPDPTLPESAMGDPNTTYRPRGPEDSNEAPCGFALVVYAGSQLGRLFPISVGENLIGRSPTAAITLLDEEVSRSHARLSLDSTTEGSRITLKDLGSTNGTFVNGKAVLGETRISTGDRLAIGGHVLKIVAMDPLERSFHETLLDQSTKDPLTGMANRGAILADLQSRFELSRRHGRSLSVVMCDLDFFKRINDTHGHGAGDTVLSSFGDLLRLNLRGTDLAGRIGGEEFLLVLPETEMEGAMFLAERIRTALAETPQIIANEAVPVTCSIGVAERNATDRNAGMLLGRADGALYVAKSSGRNRVEAAGKS